MKLLHEGFRMKISNEKRHINLEQISMDKDISCSILYVFLNPAHRRETIGAWFL